jgi:type IV pilus assembly protein PilQ
MRSARVMGFWLLVTLTTVGLDVTMAADAPMQLKDVKVAELPQSVTVTLETSGPTRYQATVIEAPTRIVIDMNGAYMAPRRRWTPAPEPIREIRGSQWKPDTARLVVELTRPVAYRIQEGPSGLSIVLESSKNGRVDAAKLETAPKLAELPVAPANLDAPRSDAPKPVAPALMDVKPERAKTDVRPLSRAVTAALAPMPAAPTPGVPTRDPDVMAPRVAQAQPPATGDRIVTVPNGKLITLDFKDADVMNVLRLLGAEGGRNLIVGDDVKGKVTVSLRNVTWEQALDTILEARGLQKIEKGGVIRIVSNEQLAKERDAQARAEESKRKAEIEVRTKLAEAEVKEQDARQRKLAAEAAAAEAAARGPLKEEILRVAYADPGEIAGTLQGILGIVGQPIEPCIKVSETETETKVEFKTGGGVTSGPIAEPPFSQLFGPPRVPDERRPISISQDVLARGLAIKAHCSTNSLFLRLYAADLDRVKKLIAESLDIPLPQVKIEARMEILDRTALEAIGIQWGGAGAANTGRATLIGQGFQSPVQPAGTGVSNFNPANPNLNLSGLLPVFPDTGLPFGGNLVNLPISALPNAAGVLPAAGLAFGIVGTNFNVNLALQALSTLGKTRTLARPEIVTVENHRATMSLGEEIPYATVSSAGTQIQFKEALLKLEVIPMVVKETVSGQALTKIKMFVVVENNSRGDVVNLGTSGSPPAINKRRARTQVLMNEGERLVIGGVTTGQNQDTIRKVPIMGDIPVLGWLFKQKETFEQGRELVVFLTPSVLKTTVAGVVPGK